jgi:hypothetical protein
MAIDSSPAVRHVTVRVAANGSPLPSSPGTPTNPRMTGFTKMM